MMHCRIYTIICDYMHLELGVTHPSHLSRNVVFPNESVYLRHKTPESFLKQSWADSTQEESFTELAGFPEPRLFSLGSHPSGFFFFFFCSCEYLLSSQDDQLALARNDHSTNWAWKRQWGRKVGWGEKNTIRWENWERESRSTRRKRG